MNNLHTINSLPQNEIIQAWIWWFNSRGHEVKYDNKGIYAFMNGRWIARSKSADTYLYDKWAKLGKPKPKLVVTDNYE